jgi:hypothetical protein
MGDKTGSMQASPDSVVYAGQLETHFPFKFL